MRKLVLVMPSETYVDPEDFSRIVKMLRLSTELRDLRVLCDSSSRPGMAIQSWMLEGHTFKLTTFANSYFSYGRMEKFLASQPEIETLHIVRKYSAGLDGTLMPNLKNLHCSISAGMSDLYGLPSAFHNKSNWERLRVTMSFLGHSQELERFSRWIKTQFGSTLKCLSISTHLLWHWQDWIEESMANVAKHLPGIKFLEITDYTTSVRYFKPFLVPLHRALSLFHIFNFFLGNVMSRLFPHLHYHIVYANRNSHTPPPDVALRGSLRDSNYQLMEDSADRRGTSVCCNENHGNLTNVEVVGSGWESKL
jgi:hypothetical protein